MKILLDLMKPVLLSLWLFCTVSGANQAQSFFSLDKSPMDAAYLPDHFAHDREPGQKAIIKVYYSRPQKNGREIFGAKVPYGKVWRVGANEAVELKAYQDIMLDGHKLAAGTYSLFAIPEETEWTLIINSDLDYWGAFSYNQANDVLRVKVPTKTLDQTIEAFSIRFEDLGNQSAVMRLAWDKTLVELPVSY